MDKATRDFILIRNSERDLLIERLNPKNPPTPPVVSKESDDEAEKTGDDSNRSEDDRKKLEDIKMKALEETKTTSDPELNIPDINLGITDKDIFGDNPGVTKPTETNENSKENEDSSSKILVGYKAAVSIAYLVPAKTSTI